MSKLKTEDVLKDMAESVTGEFGLELVDVEYIKEGGTWFVRVFIDKPEGINHDDCQQVSEKLSDLLDEKDPIPHAYVLEVSSPGIERPLKKPQDFERFKGYKVRASTYFPVNGEKEFVGELVGLIDGNIVIDIAGNQLLLAHDAVAKIRLEAQI